MKKTLVFVFLAFLACQATWADPAYYITAPPVANNGFTGPANDPPAHFGQWFSDGAVLPIEFYDQKNSAEIFGTVTSITYAGGGGPGANITAFDITATIPAFVSSVPMGTGTNSHGEILSYVEPYTGPITNARITAEFAVTDLQNLPPAWVAPYFNDPHSGGAYYIEATNEDHSAWYCWTPDNPMNLVPTGGYYVPSWNIMGGGSVVMSFAVTGAGMPWADPRYAVIQNSFLNVLDVLSNRTSSLKISDWLETLSLDVPPYEEPAHGSDVSVFIPEPVSLVSLGLGGAILAWRRKVS